MTHLRRLVQEIHRRSLWQVLGIYLVGSWVALDVAGYLTENFGLPAWFPAFALALLVLGLPAVLATAFVHEGLGRRADGALAATAAPTSAASPAGRKRLFTWRNALGGGVLAFALLGMVAAGWKVWGDAGEVTQAIPSIAVLPFASMSAAEGESDFLAAGVHEEIIAHLARLRNLKVISRTSVMEYAEGTKNLRQIADELGVRMILEGSVRSDRERVRITAQLIDADTDEHLWAETYDRTLTAGSLFETQSDIAQAIAERLRVEVSPEAREGIETRPTESLEAYQSYLEAVFRENRSQTEPDMRGALERYERAVDLDPGFAAAYAKAGQMHTRLWWYHYDRSRDRLDRAKAAIDQALALDLSSPEAWIAFGHYHYWGFLDYERALEAFDRASELQPSNGDLHAGIAYVRRRQGRFEEALTSLLEAVELSPRSADLQMNLAQSYVLVRRYEDAERALQRAIGLNPTWAEPYNRMAMLAIRAAAHTGQALRWRNDARAAGPPGVSQVAYEWIWLDLATGAYDQALEHLDTLSWPAYDDQFRHLPKALYRAWAHELAGHTAEARRAYEEAARVLEQKVRERPEDPRYHSSLGIAYAALGRRDDALREGKLGEALMPLHREAWRGGYRLEDLARIHAMVGEADEAVAILRRLLAVPSELSPGLLAVDPAWRPLHGHPGFEALRTGAVVRAPEAAAS